MRALIQIALATGILAGPSTAGDLEGLLDLGVDAGRAKAVMARWSAATGDEEARDLVAVVAAAAGRQAPADLLLDKAAEGLAKGVPPERLVPVLERLGAELGEVAALARDLRGELDPGDLSERETILRLHLLCRTAPSQDWLRSLREGAREGRAGVRAFLGVGEAVGRLTDLGLTGDEASDAGRRWLQTGVRARDVGTLVRAVESAGARMPVAEAVREVTERVARGMAGEAVLADMDRLGPGSDARWPRGRGRPGPAGVDRARQERTGRGEREGEEEEGESQDDDD